MAREGEAREAASVWHTKSLGDLEAARACLDRDSVPGWVSGFHLQQAVEKALKGLILLTGQEPPHTHDLARLHQVLHESGGTHPLRPEDLQGLQPFAVEERYPILTPEEVGRDEVMTLLGPAEAAVEALEKELGESGD